MHREERDGGAKLDPFSATSSQGESALKDKNNFLFVLNKPSGILYAG